MNQLPPHIISKDALMESLAEIKEFMRQEALLKNTSLQQQTEIIQSLMTQSDEFKQQISLLQKELIEVRHMAEGKKQLVDKLLGDIARLQQDVEWYRRTYEERSFWGTVKEKILRRRKLKK